MTHVVLITHVSIQLCVLRSRYLEMKVKDQEKALAMIDGDPGLHDLRTLRAPYLDLEV